MAPDSPLHQLRTTCEECSTELHHAGAREHRYLACRYCGTVVPVAA